MAKGYLGIRLPPSAHGDARDLLLKMVFAIHSSGGEVWVKGKQESNCFTNFVMHTYVPVDAKKIKVSMYMDPSRNGEGDSPRLYLRTRRKYIQQSRAFARVVLGGIIGESLQYNVDVLSNLVMWRMGDRSGCVEDVFEVVRTVDYDSLGEVQWHVFDYQNRSMGTVLKPGIYYL